MLSELIQFSTEKYTNVAVPGKKEEVGAAGLGLRGCPRLRVRALDDDQSIRAILPVFGKISANCCSFAAVSAPIFATKYAFCSIFQNLPDFQAEIFEIWQYFAIFATFAKCLLKIHENC